MFSCSLVPLFSCSLVLLFSCSLVLLLSCSLVLLFSCSLVLLFSCSIVLLFSCSLVLLFSCSLVLLFSCSLVLLFSYSLGLSLSLSFFSVSLLFFYSVVSKWRGRRGGGAWRDQNLYLTGGCRITADYLLDFMALKKSSDLTASTSFLESLKNIFRKDFIKKNQRCTYIIFHIFPTPDK